MKQGQATSSHMGSTKQEPKGRGVSVEAVSDLGAKQYHSSAPLYSGKGVQAPAMTSSVHLKGSQGKR